MITIYAEKFDVGIRIACALSNFKFNNKIISVDKVDANKKALETAFKSKGFIDITWNGEPTYITWGQGHLLELKQASDYDPNYRYWSNIPLPFFKNKYETKIKNGYDFKLKKSTGKPDEKIKKQLALIKDLFDKSDLIINATDDDREGELIFALVYEYTKSKTPYKRVTLASQTEDGFIKAFNNLKDSSEVKSKENAGRARQIADFIVGVNLTVAVTLRNTGEMYSVGRVQTPVLNMIVKRDLEIANFESETFYTINSELDKNGETFIAKYGDRFKTEKEANKIINEISNFKAKTKEVNSKITKKMPPLLHNLTSLQKECNNILGLSAAETLSYAQKLYEGGYITYPRTSSRHLNEDMQSDVDEILNNFEEKYPEVRNKRRFEKRFFDDSKVESHYAMIPTRKEYNYGSNKIQDQVYEIVSRSLVMSQLDDALIEETSAVFDIGGYDFYSNGSVIKQEGFLSIVKVKQPDQLPVLIEGEELDSEPFIKEGKTTPPPKLNDSSLLSMMVNVGSENPELKEILNSKDGIGTEATRANIIKTLIDRGYAQYSGKSITATQKGINFIEALTVEDLKSAEMTAKWEQRLNKIEDNEDNMEFFIKDIEDITRKWLAQISRMKSINSGNKNKSKNSNQMEIKCPVCGEYLIDWTTSWFCPNKDFGLQKNFLSVDLKESDLKDLCEKRKTRYINGFISNKSGNKFPSPTSLILNEKNELKFEFQESKTFKCPICNGKVRSYNWGYGCENRDFSIGNEIASVKITDKIVDELCKNRETKLIKDFINNNGEKFEAKLIIKDDNKIGFKRG